MAASSSTQEAVDPRVAERVAEVRQGLADSQSKLAGTVAGCARRLRAISDSSADADVGRRSVSPGTGDPAATTGLDLSCVVRPAGLEPATLGLGNRCSVLLSYGRARKTDYFTLYTAAAGSMTRNPSERNREIRRAVLAEELARLPDYRVPAFGRPS